MRRVPNFPSKAPLLWSIAYVMCVASRHLWRCSADLVD